MTTFDNNPFANSLDSLEKNLSIRDQWLGPSNSNAIMTIRDQQDLKFNRKRTDFGHQRQRNTKMVFGAFGSQIYQANSAMFCLAVPGLTNMHGTIDYGLVREDEEDTRQKKKFMTSPRYAESMFIILILSVLLVSQKVSHPAHYLSQKNRLGVKILLHF